MDRKVELWSTVVTLAILGSVVGYFILTDELRGIKEDAGDGRPTVSLTEEGEGAGPRVTPSLMPPELIHQGAGIHVQIGVTNVCESTPAINRRTRVYYKWVPRADVVPSEDTSSWDYADLRSLNPVRTGQPGDEEIFDGEIPAQKAGYVWYFYEVKYDGYWWSGKMNTSDPVTEDNPGPAYLADGETTHYRPRFNDVEPGPTNPVPSSVKVNTYRTRFQQVKVPIQE